MSERIAAQHSNFEEERKMTMHGKALATSDYAPNSFSLGDASSLVSSADISAGLTNQLSYMDGATNSTNNPPWIQAQGPVPNLAFRAPCPALFTTFQVGNVTYAQYTGNYSPDGGGGGKNPPNVVPNMSSLQYIACGGLAVQVGIALWEGGFAGWGNAGAMLAQGAACIAGIGQDYQALMPYIQQAMTTVVGADVAFWNNVANVLTNAAQAWAPQLNINTSEQFTFDNQDVGGLYYYDGIDTGGWGGNNDTFSNVSGGPSIHVYYGDENGVRADVQHSLLSLGSGFHV